MLVQGIRPRIPIFVPGHQVTEKESLATCVVLSLAQLHIDPLVWVGLVFQGPCELEILNPNDQAQKKKKKKVCPEACFEH